MKDSGYVLLFTPNFESVAVNLQKQDANMVYPGQHLHHFTKKSMEKMCELVDMHLFSFRTKGLDIGDVGSYLKFKGKAEVSSFFYEHADLLQSVIDESGCANYMRIILQNSTI